jgi:hypothetical protein
MGRNYMAFEYAKGQPDWWYEIVDGLPHPIVKDGYIGVWDKPGFGITFNVRAAKAHIKKRIAISSTEMAASGFASQGARLSVLTVTPIMGPNDRENLRAL